MRSVTGLPILNAAQRQSFDALLSPLPTVSLEQVNQRARMMSRMDRKYVLSSDQCAGILAQLPDETPVMSIGGALSQRSLRAPQTLQVAHPHLPSNRWHSTLTHHFDLPAAA